ncbi:MAG: hypothetical protein JWM73_156, partial [Solirubrobacterales bacterium]|nr:hypothetical protein [Solirubrobacterales bacterium]
PPPGVGRDVGVAVLVVALVGLLIFLGNHSGNDKKSGATATTTTPTTPAKTTPGGKKRPRHKTTPATPRFTRLEIVPTGPVWICLEAAGSRRLLAGEVVDTTSNLPVYRSSRFRMTLGNGALNMRINGKTLSVPEVQNAIGYEIDRTGKRTVLAEADRPTCA